MADNDNLLDDFETDSDTNQSGSQGFASMDPGKQRKIASKGGKASHRSGNAHEWDSQEAKEAGRKGGNS